MRLGFGLAGLAIVALAACSEAKVEQARKEFGCVAIDGLKQIDGDKQPAYVVIGEMTETSEGPAAFAEIACNLAASGKLFVGVSEYLGGATDAEIRMRRRIDALIAKGAPISIVVISDQNREWNPRDRTGAEKRWADSIVGKMKVTGATHALLLVPHTDARDAAYPPAPRFAGYDPMPMHLPEGQVMSLEIGASPAPGLTAPTVRLYPSKTQGFHGQVALASLTRPGVALAMPDPDSRQKAQHSGAIMSDPIESIFLPPAKANEVRSGQGTVGVYRPPLPDVAASFPPGDIQLDIPDPVVDLPDFKADK